MAGARTTPRVHVGTCGFREAQGRTFRDLGALEVQRTFYQPPRVATAELWRAEAPRDFVFSLKAWQLVTHEAGSPTCRRLRGDSATSSSAAPAVGLRAARAEPRTHGRTAWPTRSQTSPWSASAATSRSSPTATPS